MLENKHEEKKISKTKQASDFERAEAVQTQKKVFNTVLQQRILMQKLLIAANKFPQTDAMKLFTSKSDPVKQGTIACRRALKSHIKELQQV